VKIVIKPTNNPNCVSQYPNTSQHYLTFCSSPTTWQLCWRWFDTTDGLRSCVMNYLIFVLFVSVDLLRTLLPPYTRFFNGLQISMSLEMKCFGERLYAYRGADNCMKSHVEKFQWNRSRRRVRFQENLRQECLVQGTNTQKVLYRDPLPTELGNNWNHLR
jgi:hypothetical protein